MTHRFVVRRRVGVDGELALYFLAEVVVVVGGGGIRLAPPDGGVGGQIEVGGLAKGTVSKCKCTV